MKYVKYALVIVVGVISFLAYNTYVEIKIYSQNQEAIVVCNVLECYVYENKGSFPSGWNDLADTGYIRPNPDSDKKRPIEVQYAAVYEDGIKRSKENWLPVKRDDFSIRFGATVEEYTLKDGTLCFTSTGQTAQLIGLPEKWNHNAHRFTKEKSIEIYKLMLKMKNSNKDDNTE